MLETPFPEQMPIRYIQRKAFMKMLPHIRQETREWWKSLPYSRTAAQKPLAPVTEAPNDDFLAQYDIFLPDSIRAQIEDSRNKIKVWAGDREFDIDAEQSDPEEISLGDWFTEAEKDDIVQRESSDQSEADVLEFEEELKYETDDDGGQESKDPTENLQEREMVEPPSKRQKTNQRKPKPNQRGKSTEVKQKPKKKRKTAKKRSSAKSKSKAKPKK